MFESCGASHVGHVRANNEDSFETVPELGLFVVADGLGGEAAGERASALAVKTVVEEARATGEAVSADALLEAVELANKSIRWEAENDPCLEGMATTITAALTHAGKLEIVNVGDSRAYRFSRGQLECLTQDHTWLSEIAKNTGQSPERLKHHPLRNMLTKAVGVEPVVGADRVETGFEPGDILLLCSDGLHGVLPAEIITRVLADTLGLQDKLQALIDETLGLGAPDNVTVVLVRHTGTGE